MSSFAKAERAELADALEQVGHAAPTLCEGWDAADLAAHVIVRERRPIAALGLVVKPLAGITERSRTSMRDSHSYEELLRLFRSGPPGWSPIRVGALDEATNVVEYFVHTEDVRRAQPEWAPRVLPEAMEDVIWKRLRGSARLMLRRAPVGLVLERDGGESVTAKHGDPAVIARGRPSELMLLAFGRGKHAKLEFDGPPEAVAQLLGARFGI